MTEAQLKGIVAEVIRPEMHKFTANFMEELTASKDKLEQRYIDTAFDKMEERRDADAQLVKHVTGQVVEGLREEFATQNQEILRHFVDLQSNTHITTLDLCRNYRQQIKDLKLELEHAQKTAENLRHVVRETKREDHL